jgi:dienelactone hydrolase
MADVVVFHHALGLTEAVSSLAERLRAAGHTVHSPDLYDGVVHDDLEAGLAHAERLGFDVLLERGAAAVDPLPPELVYVGLSLGVMPAQRLAQQRARARGAVLCFSCVPTSEFGGWPVGVPVQVHGMDHDPFFAGEGDLEAAQALVAEADAAALFLYPGTGHLFTEPGPDHDAEAAELMTQRVVDFVGRC